MKTLSHKLVHFDLPADLACPPPTEDRGLERDEVRLMVTRGAGDASHDQFLHLDRYLEAGDVLVVNTSAVVPAALPVRLPRRGGRGWNGGNGGSAGSGGSVGSYGSGGGDGSGGSVGGDGRGWREECGGVRGGNGVVRGENADGKGNGGLRDGDSGNDGNGGPKGDLTGKAEPHNGVVHLSTQVGGPSGREWLFEIRAIRGTSTVRWKGGVAGMVLPLPGGGHVSLKRRFFANEHLLDLWIGDFYTPGGIFPYLDQHGRPIKYMQLDAGFPLSYFQTLFACHPGSSEMPSAGRGFTERLVRKLLARGVQIVPILLHTGVSSLEDGEQPYPEYLEVDALAALQINAAKAAGGRVIAVGTTAIRALESAAGVDGAVRPYRGETDLFIDSRYRMRVTDGLLTGFHEPRASHLHILQALAGFGHVEWAYREAVEGGYFWHQFGDLHLVLGG